MSKVILTKRQAASDWAAKLFRGAQARKHLVEVNGRPFEVYVTPMTTATRAQSVTLRADEPDEDEICLWNSAPLVNIAPEPTARTLRARPRNRAREERVWAVNTLGEANIAPIR